MTTDLTQAFLKAVELIVTLDPEVMGITFLSLRVSLTAVALASLVGMPAGVLLGTKDFMGKRVVQTLVNTGMAFPPVVMGLLVFLLFSNSGPLGPLNLLLTESVMIIAQLLLAIPILTGLTAGAVANLDPRMSEVALTLGASPVQRLCMVLRETRVALLAAMIASFGAAISEIGAVQIVGGNIRYKTRTLTTAVGKEISAGRWEAALALGIILLGTALATNIILTYLQHSQRLLRSD